jgi:molecular chaperone GrpE (heat shock protein)
MSCSENLIREYFSSRSTIWLNLLVFLSFFIYIFVAPAYAVEATQTNSVSESESTSSSGDVVPEQSVTSRIPSEATVSNSGVSGLIIAIISLAIISILSLSITFWLYRWRRRISEKNEIVVPESWHANSDRHDKNLKIQQKRIGELESVLENLISHSKELQKNIEGMTDTFLRLQGALDEKDKEIKRLQGGYDAEIFRRFLNRFIRVDQVIEDSLGEENIDLDSLLGIRQILEDAFDECGLCPFEPELKQNYAEADGVADNPKIIPNQDPSVVGTIVEVREKGYRLHTGEIIRPAKVSIYGAPD